MNLPQKLSKRSRVGRGGTAWSSPGTVRAVFEGHRGLQKLETVYTTHTEENPMTVID